MFPSKINWLILFGWAILCSAFCKDLVSIIDQDISALNKTKFDSDLGLKTLNQIISSLSSENRTENYKYSVLFSERGGVDVVAEWFEEFLHQNQSKMGNFSLTKLYFGQLMQLIDWAVDYTPFCDRMVNGKLLGRLLNFALSPILFSDSNFTEDIFVISSYSILWITESYLQPKVKRTFYNIFGSQLEKVRNRFHLETNLFVKLLAANLLSKRKLSSVANVDLQEFSISQNFLVSYRNTIKSVINKKTDREYSFNMTTPFFSQPLNLTGSSMLKNFNYFLLSKKNRLELCDWESFEFYFLLIQQFSQPNSNYTDYNHDGCIYSLRALFILTQTCDKCHQNFKKFHLDCK